MSLWGKPLSQSSQSSAPNSGSNQAKAKSKPLKASPNQATAASSAATASNKRSSPNKTAAATTASSSSAKSKPSVAKYKPPTEEEIAAREELDARIQESHKQHLLESVAPKHSLSTVNAQLATSQLWVDKYAPKRPEDIVGNQTLVAQIQNWLKSFPTQYTKSTFKRALLLIGGPGVGKSTAATVVARSLGWHVTEFNASDVRSKRSIEEQVRDLVTNRGMNEFYNNDRNDQQSQQKQQNPFQSMQNKNKSQDEHKTVVIMDEIDGMAGNEDRGGMQSVLQLIKTTRVPIICICNDASSQKMKSLKTNTHNITWKRLPAKQLAPHVMKIAQREGFQISLESVELMCEQTQSDIRQVLNLLQMWSQTQKSCTTQSAQQRMQQGSKDFAQDVYGVVGKFFDDPLISSTGGTARPTTRKFGKTWLDERQDYYYVDQQFIPLFIAELYASVVPTCINKQAPPRQQQCDVLHALSQAADSISDSDLISNQMFRTQEYSLSPAHCMTSCIIPGHLMRGSLNRSLGFPQWLGRNSTQGKNRRLLSELRLGLSLSLHCSDASQLQMYDLSLLRMLLSEPLIKLQRLKQQARQEQEMSGQQSGREPEVSSSDLESIVESLIQRLDDFGLTRDEWQTVIDLSDSLIDFAAQPWRQVIMDTKTKSTFTRKYKKSSNLLKVARVALKGQADANISKGKKLTIEGELEDDDEAEQDDSQDEADDADNPDQLKNDAMVQGSANAKAGAPKGKPRSTKATSGDSSPNQSAAPKKPAAKRKAPAKPANGAAKKPRATKAKPKAKSSRDEVELSDDSF